MVGTAKWTKGTDHANFVLRSGGEGNGQVLDSGVRVT